MNNIKLKYKENKKSLKLKYKTNKKDSKTKYKDKKKSLKKEYKDNKSNKDNKSKNSNLNLNTNNKEVEENIELPRYTKGEEIFNMVSHIVGGALGISALIVTLILSISKHSGIVIFSSIIYSLSMLTLYTMSSIYHGLSSKLKKAKNVFRKFDYISIFLLIAGSYTIFLLTILRPADPKAAWILFGIIWSATVLGTILNAINVKKFIVLSNIAFIIMGWSILWKVKVIKELMHPTGFLFLVLGGIAYTLGVIFYIVGKKVKYMHSIFHLFIVAGSIFHFISIVGYVL